MNVKLDARIGKEAYKQKHHPGWRKVRNVLIGGAVAAGIAAIVIDHYSKKPGIEDTIEKDFYGIDANRSIVKIDTKKVYCNSGSGCVLGSGTYSKLLEAEAVARGFGYQLAVFSGYRGVKRQTELFEAKVDQTIAAHNRKYRKEIASKKKKAMTREQGEEYAYQWVARPSPKSPHANGAADVYFRSTKDGRILNRPRDMNAGDWRMLEYIMFKAGFEARYIPEPWHFEYGLKIPGLKDRIYQKDYRPGKDVLDNLRK